LIKDGGLLVAVVGDRLGRPVQVALRERGPEAELAVGVEVLRRDRHAAGRLEDEQVGGLAGRVELEAIGGAAGDDHVVEGPERERAEHGGERAPAAVDEDDLVGVGVSEQLRLGRLGSAPGHRHVVVD
jgi:hypothetical protein